MLALLNFLFAPFRILFRVLQRLFAGGRGAARAAKSVGGAGGEALANRADPSAVRDLAAPVTSRRRGGIERFLFKELQRPRLVERDAADLTIEEARDLVGQSEHFYGNDFNLFAQGEFFYEEVEEAYLNEALGLETGGIDSRFVRVMTDFRKALNDNTRRLHFFMLPLLSLAAGLCGWMLIRSGNIEPPGGEAWHAFAARLPEGTALPAFVYGGTAIAAWFLMATLYNWPFKVTQQRNILNLDNYITSKFGRINQNFQVAKRRALNVERDKRMAQREELKEEAGIWTLSYHWLATRLLLCELMIRNKIYQVRRNTILYWFGGLALGLFMAAAATAISNDLALGIATAATVTVGFVIIVPGSFRSLLDVLEANEWSRFHLIDLDATIAEHVGEDKVQIVTFRDRNRIE